MNSGDLELIKQEYDELVPKVTLHVNAGDTVLFVLGLVDICMQFFIQFVITVYSLAKLQVTGRYIHMYAHVVA